ncbi:MAG: GTPase Era [Burkholderiales bacterium]|nr:GTPase Era [Burkholderiales bacterium]
MSNLEINDNHLDSRCGFIAIIGRPNVGKSTLMNHLIGQKISITSRKPQTTQHKIKGVFTENNYQFIFVDTPGFQKRYLNKFNNLLNQAVIDSLSQVDVILYVVEAGLFNAGDEAVIALLPPDRPVILVVNKQDKIKDKGELKKYIAEISTKFPFKDVVQLSAKHHAGIDEMLGAIKPYLPLGQFLYPMDQLTDRNTQFLVGEIIREKLFRHLGQELPYNIAVLVDEYSTSDPKLTRISATILVDKINQKGMVIGKDGAKLKIISSEARLDIEHLINCKVFLQVWVKVKSGFAGETAFLKQFET